jgi:hypothetical protein
MNLNITQKKWGFLASMILCAFVSFAQVTTSSMLGSVKDTKGEDLIGATVQAMHTPTGTNYGTATNEDGRFNINNMRIGGPYTITVSYVGYKTFALENVYLKLGEPSRLTLTIVEENMNMGEVEVVYKKNALINGGRTGSTTNVGNAQLNALPTLNRSLEDFTRLNPNVKGGGGQNALSFAGIDNRFNNLTIDGSVFNNSFGLQALPGSQTNSTPISLDALEEVQINLAPYDVKQGGFAGAGINAVTRSGTNTWTGSAFYNNRNNGFIGKKDYFGNKTVQSTTAFGVNQVGFRLGGPIIKNKAFFFVNYETELRKDPGTTFFADNANGSIDANETRVKETDLNEVSALVKSKFGYDTGAFQNYDLNTSSHKALVRLDYNVSMKHKLSARFNVLKSKREVPGSSSGGFNGRRDNLFGMMYQNTNYDINNDIYSGIVELNSVLGSKFSNKFLIGYTANRDYRAEKSTSFPTIDILEGGRNYITLGSEPFTPNNKLFTNTFQAINQSTYVMGKHQLGAGVSFERFEFENTFTPTVNGQYAFNSLADFKKAVNGDSVVLNRFVKSYSAKDDKSAWSAILKVNQIGAYIQDEWDIMDNLRITLGARIDVPIFDKLTESVYRNAQVDTTGTKGKGFQKPVIGADGSFTSEKVMLSTLALPKSNLNFSPRIGFNWDPFKNKSTQVRGGAGLFSGRPAFVWLANQASNNGVLSGQISDVTNVANKIYVTTKKYPLSGDVTKFIPATPTKPAKSYNIAATESDFKFPQVLRGSIAVDQKLPFGFVASVEAMYSKTLNDVYYYQANLNTPIGKFAGPDSRPRYNNTKNVSYVTDATVLGNTGDSYGYFITTKLEKSFDKGLYAVLAYNYGQSRDYLSAGSIAFSSWSQNLSVNGNNYPSLTYSNNDQRHRVVGALTYRLDYNIFAKLGGATQISLLGEAYNQGRYQYTYSGDMNGDGINGNDLMYVAKDASEMNFVEFKGKKADGKTDIVFTVDQQKTAMETYIGQDSYLKTRRGQYVERNGGVLPFVGRVDLNLVQEFKPMIKGKSHTIQLRADIFNIGNLLNNKWGAGYRLNTSAPLVYNALTGTNKDTPSFRMATIKDAVGDDTINYSSLARTTNLGDLWQGQVGLRYSF